MANLKGYRLKAGKVEKIQPRKSVSKRIAEKKNPKRKFVRASK